MKENNTLTKIKNDPKSVCKGCKYIKENCNLLPHARIIISKKSKIKLGEAHSYIRVCMKRET